MAQVTMADLSKQTGLPPKVIRRLIRKNFPNSAGRGQYLWDDTNPNFKTIVKVLSQYKKKSEKPKSHKEERKRTPTTWDDRGFCIDEDGYWAIVLVPTVADPDAKEAKTVWLGKVTDVEPIISGDKPVPDNATSLQRLAFTQILEGGK